jgi:hypothetical protein
MLEIKDDKVKIWYRFNSSRCSVKDDCENWDLNEFSYKIDLEDAKDVVVRQLAKNIESNNTSDLLEALDELDSWSCIDWGKIILSCEDLIKEYYEIDAMDFYAETREEW